MRVFRAVLYVDPDNEGVSNDDLAEAILVAIAGETLYGKDNRQLGVVDDIKPVYAGEADAADHR